MKKEATTLDEQIARLQNRGMIISDVDKAKEVLSDIGYYRLGFYWFPFEQTYPNKKNRRHDFRYGVTLDDVVKLYYFDFHFRSILAFYLNRIEINFRSTLTYIVSNEYKGNPWWFVDTDAVMPEFVESFDLKVYNANFKKNKAIDHHHKKYPKDKYAPAWKTIEYMTFGNIVNLYTALKDNTLKRQICERYGINQVVILENYLNIAKELRNISAHGNVLFDYVPTKYIRRGPAGLTNTSDYRNLYGSVKVVLYLLKHISVHRYEDMVSQLQELTKKYSKTENVTEVLKNISGISATIDW